MKVLVTGANGFVGNNIIRELNRRNIPVRALVRNTADTRILDDTRVELYHGEILEKDVAAEAVKGCNVIIHAAADTSFKHKSPEEYIKPNLTATVNLLDAGADQNVERFIYVSTANAFGYGNIEDPGNETKPARYPFTLSGYATSKIRAQDKVLEYVKTRKLRGLVVNPTFMIGPHDPKPSSGRILTMMFNRRLIPVPPGGKNFVHVDDVAKAVCNAIALGKSGQCYVLAHKNLSYFEFFRIVSRVTGKHYRLLKLGPEVLNFFGFIGNLASIIGFGTDMTLTNTRMLCVDNYYTGAKAVKELGLPQTPIEQAVKDAIDWFKANGYLK